MKAEVKQSRNLKFACAYCIPLKKTKPKVEKSGIIEVEMVMIKLYDIANISSQLSLRVLGKISALWLWSD